MNMMDAGQDAGFSQGFDGGDFSRPAPRAVVRAAVAPPDGKAIDAAHGAGPHGLDRDGADPAVAAGLPGRTLDLLALQALAEQLRSGQLRTGQLRTGLAHDPGGSEQAVTIARQVADMAQGLAALADRLVGQGAATAADAIDVAEGDCVAFLESQFRIRRLRARHLPALSLGEPAWDILLDLAVAQFWRRETSVTSLCIAADVPSTTALRWINSMTREGLIVRRPCQRDGRRSFLAIATDTYQAMLAMAADSLRTEQRVRARYHRAA